MTDLPKVTTLKLRMAKASKFDIERCLDLNDSLRCLLSGSDPGTGDDFDIDDPRQCRVQLRKLLEKYRCAGMLRVVMGMSVLSDPSNEIVDPDVDYLAPHPRFQFNRDPNT